MCLILVAHQIDAGLPLLVLANRDEFHARATAPIGPWPESPGLLAGRDLVGGGSWLGVNGQRWAAVTNVREGLRDHAAPRRSRGWLVRDYLIEACTPLDYLRQVMPRADQYPGFNLLLGDRDGVWYGSNRAAVPRRLPPGLYGLSNHQLDTPWPKVVQAKHRLADWLAKPERLPEQALALLTDTRCAADPDLPATGVPLAWERTLSAMFIISPRYGTRSTTLLARGQDGAGLLVERSFHGSPQRWTQRRYRLRGG